MFLHESFVVGQPERLQSNILQVKTIPPILKRFRTSREISQQERNQLLAVWPARQTENERTFRSFQTPRPNIVDELRLTQQGQGSLWSKVAKVNGIYSNNIVKSLLKKSLYCPRPETVSVTSQMFLDTGDGVVFKGENGPWYSPESKQFHLDKGAAKGLLDGVLRNYRKFGGKELTEIFLHSRSRISEEEFEGYSEACPESVKLVGVAIQKDRSGVRLFRPGEYAVLRGTCWQVNEKTGYLWTSGFKPRLATYDGWETPVPLRIEIQHGKADFMQVAKDVLGLTKLNYNSCRLGDSEPVTVKFSDLVGEILVSNPTIPASEIRPQFKFYI